MSINAMNIIMQQCATKKAIGTNALGRIQIHDCICLSLAAAKHYAANSSKSISSDIMRVYPFFSNSITFE